MSALLEYECQVPVGGYEVITIERSEMLQPRSERTRRFDLFKARSSVFLEFAQTPDTPDGIKAFADRYGPLAPPPNDEIGRSIGHWQHTIRRMRETVELWQKSMITGDFSTIIRVSEKQNMFGGAAPGGPASLLLKKDPLSGSARLCIRPHWLYHALWVQFALAIDGNVNLGACVQCRKWFTVEAGRGRSDKEYCSNACRMRAYRKRKGTGSTR